MSRQAAAVLETRTHEDRMNIGLSATYRDDMANRLSAILADTYKLVIKSHVYHWNVVGPLFKPLHELTEAHGIALFAAADIIAERIRALGHLAPSHLSEASKFAPAGGDVQKMSAETMVDNLIADDEAAVRSMREAASVAGDKNGKVTEDMLTDRLTFHETALWMLRAHVA